MLGRRSLAAIAVVAASLGCSPEPRSLTWGFRFDPPALRERAVFVEAEIRAGGCDGAAVYAADVAVDAPTAPAPPALSAGTYGFSGRARDSSCTRFADGCIALRLPDQAGTEAIVVLEGSVREDRACDEAACMSGRCAPGDVDGGGPIDGGPIEGGPMDGAATDGSCGTEICNEIDDDCDSNIDEGFDLSNDSMNCGSCGRRCNEATCSGGSCVCPGSLVASGPRCEDPQADPRRCGGSGECDSDEYCEAGTCVCRPGLTRAGSSCVDLSSDPANCGALGMTCDSGQVCSAGACTTTCASGLTLCPFSSVCADTSTSPLDCGGECEGCERDEVCARGDCQAYRTGVDLSSGTACASCPCPSCTGDYDRCCTYGTNVICVREADGCP